MAVREELRDFLQSRRTRHTGGRRLPSGRGVRRVPGLRREELAQLAGVSVDYDTRLEQGRDLDVSVEVLRAVADALRLREDERAHLFDLTLIGTLTTPAFIVGRCLDILATDPMARALICDFDAFPGRDRITPAGCSSTQSPASDIWTGERSPATTSRRCACTPAATPTTPSCQG